MLDNVTTELFHVKLIRLLLDSKSAQSQEPFSHFYLFLALLAWTAVQQLLAVKYFLNCSDVNVQPAVREQQMNVACCMFRGPKIRRVTAI